MEDGAEDGAEDFAKDDAHDESVPHNEKARSRRQPARPTLTEPPSLSLSLSLSLSPPYGLGFRVSEPALQRARLALAPLRVGVEGLGMRVYGSGSSLRVRGLGCEGLDGLEADRC